MSARSARWAAFVCVLAACGGGGGGGGGPSLEPTSGLTYAQPSPVYTKGVAIAANAPSVQGGAPTAYAVSPALPTGLSLNPATGVISGTPAALSPAASYVVTAGNAAGSASATLRVAVVDAAPSGLQYGVPAAVYTRTVAVAPNRPSSGGGAVVSYAVSPELPAGLALDAATGTISGTPTALSPDGSYAVTAANSGGSVTATLRIAVTAVPPRGLAYAVETGVFTKGEEITPDLPAADGDPITAWAVTPALPAGLTLDPATGAISGTPGALALTATYLVTASNTGGTADALLTFTVNDLAPEELVYDVRDAVFTVGTAAAPDRAAALGGDVVAFEVTPVLPAGLALDPFTGTISGTPTAPTPAADYVVTARNSGGSADATVRITVVDRPPSDLAYATADASSTIGEPIAADAPRSSGGAVVHYQIAPELPAGLQLDPRTGVISGTPSALSPRTSYTVTATNTGGSTTATVFLTVNDAPPRGLRYADDPALYAVGEEAPPNLPSHQGGAVLRYTVSPALPAGLALDPGTGAIAGTPLAPADALDYTVTAANSGGVDTCTVRVEVVASAEQPVVALSPYVTSGKVGVVASTHRQPTGTTFAWSVSRGTITGGQGTARVVFTPGDPGPLTVTVRVTRSGEEFAASAGATIVPPPVARIFAQDRVFRNAEGLRASVPVQRDVSVRWTLSLPGGAVTSGDTAQVLTYRSGDLAGDYRLAVRVENLAGDAASDARDLQVVSREFLADPASPQLIDPGSATLLEDGRLLAVGPRGAELFDPPTSIWALVHAPRLPRGDHAATALRGGKVLLTGGYSGSSAAIASAELYDPDTRRWTDARSMSQARLLHAAVLLADGRVLVTGGSGSSSYMPTAEIYDPALDAWTPAASMAVGRQGHRATLLLDGRVLVTGGTDGSRALSAAEIYDPAADRWTPAAEMDQPRYFHVAVRLGSGKVLATGGMSFTPGDAAAALYDPATDRWTRVAPMSTPRAQAGGALLADGRVLVSGGRQDLDTFASAELFDEAAGAWSPAASLAQPRFRPLATALPDGSVLVIGGAAMWKGDPTRWAKDEVRLSSVERYSAASGTWTAAGAPWWPSLATTTVLADGRVLVAGGLVMGINAGFATAAATVYDPAAHRWTVTGPLAAPRWMHTATLLADGRVLALGGRADTGFAPPSLGTAELYDPATGAWSPAASLATVRTYHAAVRLADGRVLVAGGSTTGGWDRLAAAEAYDPAADRWMPVGDMNVGRLAHTATLLPGGQVLVAGGQEGTGTELFDPATGRWTVTGSLQQARTSHAAALLGDGTVLVSGGGPLATETYDPATGAWSAAGALAAPRRQHPMVALPSGGALLAAGYPDAASRFSEVYDPATRTWSVGAPLPGVRDGSTMVVLADGAVMLVGGAPASPPLFWRE